MANRFRRVQVTAEVTPSIVKSVVTSTSQLEGGRRIAQSSPMPSGNALFLWVKSRRNLLDQA